MKKILHIISTPKGSLSTSLQLGNAVVEKLQAAHPGSTVKEVNLAANLIPHLQEAHIHAFFTPADQMTAENTESVRYSDQAIADVMDADILVIGAPLYNFSITSTLKSWIDQIVRAGKTFKYDENGPEGLIKGKKVYIAMASGGIYSEGPMQAYDFAVPYLKLILGFVGLTDITVFRAEGLNIPEVKNNALAKAVDSIILN